MLQTQSPQENTIRRNAPQPKCCKATEPNTRYRIGLNQRAGQQGRFGWEVCSRSLFFHGCRKANL